MLVIRRALCARFGESVPIAEAPGRRYETRCFEDAALRIKTVLGGLVAVSCVLVR